MTTLSQFENRDSACIHATCVAFAGRGVLIIGPSGSGKSGLALHMMSLGAVLVADDRVELQMSGKQVSANAVANLKGLIEARGIGLLKADVVGPVPIDLVVDMGAEQKARLPDPMTIVVLRQTVPLLPGAGVPNLGPAVIQLMKSGRVDPEWPNK